MSTDTFRRHTRARVDAVVHRTFVSLCNRPSQLSLFEALLAVTRERSDLMSTPSNERGVVAQVSALRNLIDFEDLLERQPEDWPGSTGHPLRVVDSLAAHLFGRYPTPRFLASVWFGSRSTDRLDRRRWFIAHARGQRFRSLALPIQLTRRMEHVFLSTPDHLVFDAALRRAEILGLGGTPELAEIVLSTRLADSFSDPDLWRSALQWLVRCGESVDLDQVRPVIDYLHANLRGVDLRGRSFASVMRLVAAWHGWLGLQRAPLARWRRSRWQDMLVHIEPTAHEPRRAEWTIVELLDSRELALESKAMRHCVASYARSCAAGQSSIWSLRHRWCDDGRARPMLTIEVDPSTAAIVQVRAKANGPATGWPLQLVQRWAARERLRMQTN